MSERGKKSATKQRIQPKRGGARGLPPADNLVLSSSGPSSPDDNLGPSFADDNIGLKSLNSHLRPFPTVDDNRSVLRKSVDSVTDVLLNHVDKCLETRFERMIRAVEKTIRVTNQGFHMTIKNEMWAHTNANLFRANAKDIRLLYSTKNVPWSSRLEAAFPGRKCKFGDWETKKAQMAQDLAQYYGVDPDELDQHLQG